MPKVTVLMPVYNGEKFLREAIDSILNQSFSDFELIIINDGSSDSSLSIVNSYDDSRIKLINNIVNKGLVYSRNKGIAEARGKYIAMLDCDDVAYPQRLMRQFIFLENHPEYLMVGSGIETIDDKNNSLGLSINICKDDEVGSRLIFGNIFTQSSIMINRRIFANYKYREEAPFSEDYDLWIRLAENNSIINLPEALIKYRLHSGSTGTIKKNKMISAVREILVHQLKKLKISPTDRQINLHLSIDFPKEDHDNKTVDEVREWLSLLIQKNREVFLFPDDAFVRVVTEKWIKFCFSVLNKKPIEFIKQVFLCTPSRNSNKSVIVAYLLFEKYIRKSFILIKFKFDHLKIYKCL